MFFWISLYIAANSFGCFSGLNYVEIFRDDFNGNSIDGSKWNRVDVASQVNNELE